jgi:hypothetical protein
MIMAIVVVLVVEGTIGEMRRGCHTLGISCCGLAVIKSEGDTLCYCGCATTIETTSMLKKAYEIPQRSKWGPAEGQTALYIRMPDRVHAVGVRRDDAVMLYVISTAVVISLLLYLIRNTLGSGVSPRDTAVVRRIIGDSEGYSLVTEVLQINNNK